MPESELELEAGVADVEDEDESDFLDESAFASFFSLPLPGLDEPPPDFA